MHGLNFVHILGVLTVLLVKMVHRGSFTFRRQQYMTLKLHLGLRNHFSVIRPQIRKILKDEGHFPN